MLPALWQTFLLGAKLNRSYTMSSEFFDVSNLVTDETKEVAGVWKDLSSNAKVKIARWGNTEFTRALRRKFKANRVIMEADDDISEKVSTDLMIEVMADTILKDVQGLGFQGKLIEKYTPEIGRKLLQIKDFRDKIKGIAEDTDAYLAGKEEALVNV
jgi:hypothetical protein